MFEALLMSILEIDIPYEKLFEIFGVCVACLLIIIGGIVTLNRAFNGGKLKGLRKGKEKEGEEE